MNGTLVLIIGEEKILWVQLYMRIIIMNCDQNEWHNEWIKWWMHNLGSCILDIYTSTRNKN